MKTKRRQPTQRRSTASRRAFRRSANRKPWRIDTDEIGAWLQAACISSISSSKPGHCDAARWRQQRASLHHHPIGTASPWGSCRRQPAMDGARRRDSVDHARPCASDHQGLSRRRCASSCPRPAWPRLRTCSAGEPALSTPSRHAVNSRRIATKAPFFYYDLNRVWKTRWTFASWLTRNIPSTDLSFKRRRLLASQTSPNAASSSQASSLGIDRSRRLCRPGRACPFLKFS